MKAMNAFFRLGAAAGLLAVTSSAAFAQQVQLTIKDGRVTLKTENATVRQILDEWTRVGQTKIVNADKVTGQPLSLTLIDVPEREALDTVMRQAAGYAVVERAADAPNASMFDRILVMARTTPVTQVGRAAARRRRLRRRSRPTRRPPNRCAPEEQVALAEEPPQPAAPVVNPYAPGGGQGAPGAVGPNGMANGANAARRRRHGRRESAGEVRLHQSAGLFRAAAARAAGGGAGDRSDGSARPGESSAAAAVHQPVSGQQRPADRGGRHRRHDAAAAAEQRADDRHRHDDRAGRGARAAAAAQPPAGTGSNFNPYNMSGYQPPANSGQAPPATPVEPDRSKYANPYVPTRTP